VAAEHQFDHVHYGVKGTPNKHLHAVGMCDHSKGLRPATSEQLDLPYCGQCVNKVRSLVVGEEAKAAVALEQARRAEMERQLVAENGSMEGAPARLVNELRFYRGGRGIYFDKDNTGGAADPGVTVGVLHTGEHYDDDLSASGVIYHYPVTEKPGRDAAEVEATKQAQRLQLPVYVIVERKGARDVRKGWVLEWDDRQQAFLIEFADEPPISSFADQDLEDEPFQATEKKTRSTARSKVRTGSDKFRFAVLQRSGSRCGACNIADSRLLEAAHVIPYEDDGVDEARNGLPLCPTHHRAFDKKLLLLQPGSLEWTAPDGSDLTLADLLVTRRDIGHLDAAPHPDAVTWRWNKHKS
jgi:putative restriction endonuclease